MIDRIRTARAEARARKGWIMDTYLLRREPPAPDPRPDLYSITPPRRRPT
ncbi:hypothetical protein [Actinomadura sp. GC306]|nr:hypothetical protein [Actinomadura sp. GC306]